MHHRLLPGRHAPTPALFVLVASLLFPPIPGAREADAQETHERYDPKIAAASDEGEQALRTVRIPAGLKAELFAAEPLLANPVAFCIDERGRFYVAESFRLGAGVTDTRDHMNWLDDDLACRTVADRVAMYRKFLGKEFEAYKVEHERVRRVVDRDGDGKADDATVFADGFSDPAAGIGAGLLARDGQVWYACIPWLWKLRDTRGEGTATERILLHEGYGVHVGYLGHDLHGLIMGPDGKLYFSVGDRGFNVRTREGKSLTVPDTGSILRCNPDGTELEVFATGLRNPQELAFDEYGNLFTGDNNSDSGDKARWVYLVEGGDSGWRIGYQFMEEPYSRGPWNEEMLWDPEKAAQAAYLVPPIANVSDGPSGLTYNPGVSLLPDRYKGHFFLVDFRGASGQSGIRSFAVKPKGASFELVDSHEFAWNTLATDADFGPDGALYYSDWVEGWDKPNKGRIYRVLDPARRGDPRVARVKTLLSEGMKNRSTDELSSLLAHANMRVRRESQFELARRGERQVLERIALSGTDRLARIHAIWGLGQMARRAGREGPTSLGTVSERLLADADPEIRAQSARVAGESRDRTSLEKLVGLLADSNPRVPFFAAIALGKLGDTTASTPLLDLLRRNNDRDPYLRHAAVMGLSGLGDRDTLERAAKDPSSAVRMGVLLAFRRLEDPAVADFLDDVNPRLVLEAARAINDVPIKEALPRLAAIITSAATPVYLLRRVANANFRLGEPEHARVLAELASRAEYPEAIRAQALEMLGEWPGPSGRDKVVGLWRPLASRPAAPAIEAMRPKLDSLLASGPGTIRMAAIRAAGALGMKEAGPRLSAVVADRNAIDEDRAEALKALGRIGDPGRVGLARSVLDSGGPAARIEALRVLVKFDPAAARAAVDRLLENGGPRERQGAFTVLAEHPDPATDQVLVTWLDRLIAGKVPAEIQLDLLEAAGRRHSAEIREKLGRHEASRPKADPLAAYRETLAGGDARRGMQIFASKAEVSCLRCHKVKAPDGRSYGGEVGPELTGIGSRQDRAYLLESIVTPDRKIAQGFESVVLATTDGKVVTGVLRGEDDKEVRLVTAEGQPLAVPKDEVEDRKRGPSAMPADLASKLTKSELRDLIEFLANLRAR